MNSLKKKKENFKIDLRKKEISNILKKKSKNILIKNDTGKSITEWEKIINNYKNNLILIYQKGEKDNEIYLQIKSLRQELCQNNEIISSPCVLIIKNDILDLFLSFLKDKILKKNKNICSEIIWILRNALTCEKKGIEYILEKDILFIFWDLLKNSNNVMASDLLDCFSNIIIEKPEILLEMEQRNIFGLILENFDRFLNYENFLVRYLDFCYIVINSKIQKNIWLDKIIHTFPHIFNFDKKKIFSNQILIAISKYLSETLKEKENRLIKIINLNLEEDFLEILRNISCEINLIYITRIFLVISSSDNYQIVKKIDCDDLEKILLRNLSVENFEIKRNTICLINNLLCSGENFQNKFFIKEIFEKIFFLALNEKNNIIKKKSLETFFNFLKVSKNNIEYFEYFITENFIKIIFEFFFEENNLVFFVLEIVEEFLEIGEYYKFNFDSNLVRDQILQFNLLNQFEVLKERNNDITFLAQKIFNNYLTENY